MVVPDLVKDIILTPKQYTRPTRTEGKLSKSEETTEHTKEEKWTKTIEVQTEIFTEYRKEDEMNNSTKF